MSQPNSVQTFVDGVPCFFPVDRTVQECVDIAMYTDVLAGLLDHGVTSTYDHDTHTLTITDNVGDKWTVSCIATRVTSSVDLSFVHAQ